MPQHPFKPLSHTFNTTDFAVVAALLDYYGLPYSVRSLNDYLHHHTFGTLMTEIADCLLQHGIDTTLVNSDPELFSRPLWKKLFLQDYPRTDPKRLPTINEVERVIGKGVMLKQALPTTKLIDHELAKDQPVVIAYNPKLIEPIRSARISHGIITAVDGKDYQLFEPEFGNILEMRPKKVVILAIMGIISSDPSARSIILGKERKPTPKAPPGPLPEI